MPAADFLADFLRNAGGAAIIKDAAERVQDRPFATRADAEVGLRQALNRPDAAGVADNMLGAVGHQELKDWAGDLVTPKPKTKDEAIAVLLGAYFDLDDDEDADDGDDDDEEDEDGQDDEDEGVGYSPPTPEARRALLMPRASPHQLRDYQNDAIETAWRHRQLGTPRFQVSIPTGGGKTAVGMAVAMRELRRSGRVLWVTMNWPLLWQASETAGKDHDLYRRGELGRYGGNGKFIDVLPEARGALRFTTTHTLVSRIKAVLRSFKPTLVVWDECHWGQAGKLARPLKAALERLGVPILGLSATPKANDAWGFEKVYSVTFGDLVDRGYLARAVVESPVTTRGRAQPRVHLGEFARSYLTELADDDARNADIVAHYEKNRGHYGKTILFAVDIEHADVLEGLFAARGIQALAVHSRFDDTENGTTLHRFKNGSLDVLIGVAMVTHGLDVPDIRTVMIARPTMSDILYAQMVGRGARIDERIGKTTFRVVDFVDASNRHHDGLVLGKPYFEGAGGAWADRAQDRRKADVAGRNDGLGSSTNDQRLPPRRLPDGGARGDLGTVRGAILDRLQTGALEAVRQGDAEGRVALIAATTALSNIPATSFTLAACDTALRDLSVDVSIKVEMAARDAHTVQQRQLQRQLDVLLELRRAFAKSEALALWLTPHPADEGRLERSDVGSATPPGGSTDGTQPPTPNINNTSQNQPTTPDGDQRTTIDLTKPLLPPPPSPAPTCSHCTVALAPDQKFCHKCGTKVVRAPTTCPGCKSPWRDDANFCGECGTPAPA